MKKKQYLRPEVDTIALESEHVMLVTSGSSESTVPGMEGWNADAAHDIIWDDFFE